MGSDVGLTPFSAGDILGVARKAATAAVVDVTAQLRTAASGDLMDALSELIDDYDVQQSNVVDELAERLINVVLAERHEMSELQTDAQIPVVLARFELVVEAGDDDEVARLIHEITSVVGAETDSSGSPRLPWSLSVTLLTEEDEETDELRSMLSR